MPALDFGCYQVHVVSLSKASLGTICYVSRNTDVALNPQFTLVTAGIFDYIQYLKQSCRLVLETGMQTFLGHTYTYVYQECQVLNPAAHTCTGHFCEFMG